LCEQLYLQDDEDDVMATLLKYEQGGMQPDFLKLISRTKIGYKGV
jgi:hypothetical protein